ncbi:hypothetical protein ACR77J_17285 [Tissierella praeacuta]|uniref:hypothetical protein n=1 Tax=Tissierella praeacuta TaxID=43131 RepID=UPI003DA1D6F4
MSKINIKKVKNVECYDFETKTNIPYDEVVEVEETKFIKQKLDEEVLEEIRFENEEDDQPPKVEETEVSEESTEGGGKDDNSKGGKGKKKS